MDLGLKGRVALVTDFEPRSGLSYREYVPDSVPKVCPKQGTTDPYKARDSVRSVT